MKKYNVVISVNSSMVSISVESDNIRHAYDKAYEFIRFYFMCGFSYSIVSISEIF